MKKQPPPTPICTSFRCTGSPNNASHSYGKKLDVSRTTTNCPHCNSIIYWKPGKKIKQHKPKVNIFMGDV